LNANVFLGKAHLFCVVIELPIPTQPVTSNSASSDTGDRRDESGTGVGGGGDGDRRSSFVGPTRSSLSTGGFVYRGHTAAVICVKFSPSGTYVASGDARRRLRIWTYDHDEHLPRLDVQVLAGPVRDVCWYREGVRVAVCGDDGAQSAESSRVVMWDTRVKCGDLQAHGRRRGTTCAIRPCRPARVATGGAEDAAVYFHSRPPFKRVGGGEDGVAAPAERCHAKGAVHRLRYSSA
jgi:WD40 repeat protein